VYDSYGETGWFVVGGTSASAPQWAALIADMKSAKKGNFGNFNLSMYSVGKSSTLLHDITAGTNGTCGYVCTAQTGYDYVTGLGSPQAGNLISRFILANN
jgi:subtilase family serine protease